MNFITAQEKIIDSHICEYKSSNEEIYYEFDDDNKLDIAICSKCQNNKISTFIPCHSYCDLCVAKNNCYICKNYLLNHYKIR